MHSLERVFAVYPDVVNGLQEKLTAWEMGASTDGDPKSIADDAQERENHDIS